MSFNAIRENKIFAKISESTVVPTLTFFVDIVYLSRFKQQRHMHSDSEHSVNH